MVASQNGTGVENRTQLILFVGEAPSPDDNPGIKLGGPSPDRTEHPPIMSRPLSPCELKGLAFLCSQSMANGTYYFTFCDLRHEGFQRYTASVDHVGHASPWHHIRPTDMIELHSIRVETIAAIQARSILDAPQNSNVLSAVIFNCPKLRWTCWHLSIISCRYVYRSITMAPRDGLEPPTTPLTAERSTYLSYRGTTWWARGESNSRISRLRVWRFPVLATGPKIGKVRGS